MARCASNKKNNISHLTEKKVGDFILLRRNEISPADILIFDSKNQICHVDTVSVNGSSKLFPKQPLNQTSCKLLFLTKKTYHNFGFIIFESIFISW